MKKYSKRLMVLLSILLTGLFAGDLNAQSDEDCRLCHLDQGLLSLTALGDTVSAFIDTPVYNQSVHYLAGFECTGCHSDITDIPHEDNTVSVNCAECHEDIDNEFRESLHGYALSRGNSNAPLCYNCHGKHDIFPTDDPRSTAHRLNLPQTCGSCHNEYAMKIDPEIRVARTVEIYLGSVHGKNILAGIEAAATCSDCHGTHNLKGPADLNSSVNRSNIPATCAQCHDEIYDQYVESIHGKALKAGITDTPVCTDCHGEHSILSSLDPKSPTFQIALSEKICADCHEDSRILEKYGLLAGTLKTYQDSYHGLANAVEPNEAATCISCHGSHFILPAANEESTIHENNLVETCGICHEGSNISFAKSYSHTVLSTEGNPVDSAVRIAYITLIIILIIGMVLHNTTIMNKFIRDKYRSEKKEQYVTRFDFNALLQHILITVTFIVLVITGFALKYPNAFWVRIISSMGITETLRGLIHRISAILMIATGVYHFIYIILSRAGRSNLAAIILKRQDLKDVRTNIRFHRGKSDLKPEFGKFDYSQKIEYWALLWGTIIMVATGFILWFPEYFTQFLPSWIVKVSETVHFYEAILATLSIVIWHFFFVILHPSEYPMSMTWLTGRMSIKDAQSRHIKWYKEIVKTKGDSKH